MNNDIKRLEKLEQHIEDIYNTIKSKEYKELDEEQKVMTLKEKIISLQINIQEHRKNAVFIMDCFYNIFRDKQQDSAKKCAMNLKEILENDIEK